MTQVFPYLFEYLIAAGFGVVLGLLRRWTGLQVDATRREALQSALRNASKLLLQPGGTIDDAIDYVLRSVPDTLKHFGIDNPDEIERYLQPHIVEAKALLSSNPIRADPT